MRKFSQPIKNRDPAMERVILLGTTAGTTWRRELIPRLVARGIRPDQIINPHLPRGVHYTPEHMKQERIWKDDPATLILIYICPAVLRDPPLDAEAAREKRERLGPITMYEIGKYGASQSHRTGVVLDFDHFTAGERPRKVLEGLARELREDHSGQPPYLADLVAGEDWIVSRLA
jgi:hypothetical protein